ncbi:hypothetical protein FG05_35415 [Fusarium graminearum]|nr:hypothetical protein FG05_35415 [Fusarium graminearum]
MILEANHELKVDSKSTLYTKCDHVLVLSKIFVNQSNTAQSVAVLLNIAFFLPQTRFGPMPKRLFDVRTLAELDKSKIIVWKDDEKRGERQTIEMLTS